MAALATTLAVLSLATAVKDIVELAQQIRDAFEKVPQNYRNARNLSNDILQFAEAIQTLYEARMDIFDKAPALERSLHDLLREMRNVNDECSRLIPPILEKKRDKFKIGFYAFWNRNKVAILVLELKGRTDDCYKQFLLLSSIRNEIATNQIVLKLDGQSFPTAASTQLFQFAGSYSVPLTWMRGTIPEHDLSKAYIRRELETVMKLLRSLLSQWSQGSSTSFSIGPFEDIDAFLYESAISETECHQKVVMEVIDYQRIIVSAESLDIITLINQAGRISVLLDNYNMGHESVTAREWSVVILRHITSVFPSRDARMHLAFNLLELARCHERLREYKKSYSQSCEAMDIAHSLGLERSSPDVQLQFIVALTLNLQEDIGFVSSSIVNPAGLASRVVGLMQCVLAANASSSLLSLIDSPWSNPILDISNDERRVIPVDLPVTLHYYTWHLRSLAMYQDTDEALGTRKRALAILHSLMLLYPHSRIILDNTASLLLVMCKDTSDQCISHRLDYAKRSVDILHRLLQTSKSPVYLLLLSQALQSYQSILLLAEKYQEYENVFTEIANLAEAASHKYFDIGLPSQTEGNYYFHVAEIYRDAERFLDAIHSAQNAVAQYAALEFIDKDWDPLQYIEALVMLCTLYYNTDQYRSALWEGRKAFKLITKFSGGAADTSTRKNYIRPVTTIVNTLENISPGPIPGTLIKSTPSFENFKTLFQSELSDPRYVDIYGRLLNDRVPTGRIGSEL